MAQSESRYINILTDYGFKRVFGDIFRFLAMAMTEQAHHCSSGLTKTFLDKELDGLSHVLLTYHN